jgi:hypothetical protein
VSGINASTMAETSLQRPRADGTEVRGPNAVSKLVHPKGDSALLNCYGLFQVNTAGPPSHCRKPSAGKSGVPQSTSLRY